MKWCTKLYVAKKRYLIVLQGHPSNFKVTWLKKSSILTQIGSFRTVTPVWIHLWLWNDAQRLKQHRRGALLFFKVMLQFSRSRGTKKNANFYPTSRLKLKFDFTNGFEMMHKAWCQFSKSPGTKNRIERFRTVNSSLNMPMALKCCTKFNVV